MTSDTFEELGTKAGVREESNVQHMSLVYNNNKGMGKPPGLPPFWLNLCTYPYLTPYRKPASALSNQGTSEQKNLLFVLPCCCSRQGNKTLPEFLIWLAVIYF